MEDLSELLGTITAITFFLAILNFFVKYINRKVVVKLGKEYKVIVNFYRQGMKIVVKNHKLIGIISAIALVIHYSFVHFKTSGAIAGILLITVTLMGIYGAYINKNYKGLWLKIHRILAFVLMAAIFIHIA